MRACAHSVAGATCLLYDANHYLIKVIKVIMNPVIKPNKNLNSVIGTAVGLIKVNKSWIHHNASYECAAWWEDSSINEGVYPLILKKNNFAPYNVYLEAKLEATVIDDYFPALWGGVSISNKPYVSQNIGSKRTISKSFDIADSVVKTGDIEGSDIDICVSPFIWEAIIEAAKDTMLDFQTRMEHYWQDYRNEGDGSFDSNISMIGYCAKNINELTNAIMEIKRHLNYINSGNSIRERYAENISWIKAA